MSQTENHTLNAEPIVFKKQSAWKETWRRMHKNKSAMIGLIIIGAMLLAIVFADVLASYDLALKQDVKNRLQPPSADHIMGTDGYGRDVFARVLHGGRVSLSIGFITSLLALLAGGLLGAVAGYYGGLADSIIMRVFDVLMAIPTILLALAIVSALGSGMTNLVIAITISRVPIFVRVIRSAVLGLVDMEFVEAARAGGTRDMRIIMRHIVPNAMGTIIIQTTMSISAMILQAATLSFVGMGVQPPKPEWGYMLSEAREFMRGSSYLLLFPGVCICLSALGLNLLGDGFRDALDPRLKS